MKQKWGKSKKISKIGWKGIVNAWSTRYAYVVSHNTIRYDGGVTNCPTKDNINVHVDINIMFKIGNTS